LVGVKSFVLLYPTSQLPIDGEEFQSTLKIIDEKVHPHVTEHQTERGGLRRGDVERLAEVQMPQDTSLGG